MADMCILWLVHVCVLTLYIVADMSILWPICVYCGWYVYSVAGTCMCAYIVYCG